MDVNDYPLITVSDDAIGTTTISSGTHYYIPSSTAPVISSFGMMDNMLGQPIIFWVWLMGYLVRLGLLDDLVAKWKEDNAPKSV